MFLAIAVIVVVAASIYAVATAPWSGRRDYSLTLEPETCSADFRYTELCSGDCDACHQQ